MCNIFGILYFISRKVRTHKKVCAVRGEGAVTDRTCESGLRGSCWRSLSGGAPWSRRPAEVDSDRMEASAQNSQYHTRGRELADPECLNQ